MGVKEKVPRPARVTQSGQEANKKWDAKAAGVRTGKRDQTKCAKAERETVLQGNEEQFKRTINIILDEGHKKVNGVRVAGPQTAVTAGLVDATEVSSIPAPQPAHGLLVLAHPNQRQPPLPRASAILAGYLSFATRGVNVQLARLAAARSQRPLCSCGVMAKCVSFFHVLMRRTGWKQSNWRTSKRRKRDMPPSTG